MRHGIISDVHSNLEALEAALDALGDVDVLISPGDVVGYGPNPNECCEILRERQVITVMGNHDAVVAGRMPLDWFNLFAREAANWTQEQLTAESREFLESLPMVHRGETFVMVHGSLPAPERFEYITSPREARPTFAEMSTSDLCLIGHTHVAELYFQKAGELWSSQVSMSAGGTIDLKTDSTYIINCGSVGQPRDFNPLAAVGIFDTEARTVEIRRVEYPIQVTQRKMQEADLPEPLWRRLQHGA